MKFECVLCQHKLQQQPDEDFQGLECVNCGAQHNWDEGFMLSSRWAGMEIKRLRKWERPREFPAIVCLCGSTRFMDAFHDAGWQLTLDGYIVLTVGVCKHAEDHGGEALGEEVAAGLDELHLRKIDLCDWVFVLNVGGYVGESTRKEIEYATAIGKRVTYFEPDLTEASPEKPSESEGPGV